MTADPTTLRALIARLEAGEYGRDLDADLATYLFGGKIAWRTENYTMEQSPILLRPDKGCIGGFLKEPVPRYTVSIGAAIACANTALSCPRLVMSWAEDYASVEIIKGWGAKRRVLAPTEESHSGEDLPRLIVTATLKAKLAEVEAVACLRR